MSVLIRELFKDLVDGKLDIITRIDLIQCCQRVVREGQLTSKHIEMVLLYSSGYTISELVIGCPHVLDLLIQAFAILAEESGHTDERFLQSVVHRFPKYSKVVESYRKELQHLSMEFE